MAIILCVEDSPELREAYTEILHAAGHSVTTASNGREGIAALECADPLPDVVLLDVMMPVMDGREFRARLRANRRWRDIPVIVCSGSLDGEMVVDFAPLAGQLSKPVNVPMLLGLLCDCCGAPDHASCEDGETTTP